MIHYHSLLFWRAALDPRHGNPLAAQMRARLDTMADAVTRALVGLPEGFKRTDELPAAVKEGIAAAEKTAAVDLAKLVYAHLGYSARHPGRKEDLRSPEGPVTAAELRASAPLQSLKSAHEHELPAWQSNKHNITALHTCNKEYCLKLHKVWVTADKVPAGAPVLRAKETKDHVKMALYGYVNSSTVATPGGRRFMCETGSYDNVFLLLVRVRYYECRMGYGIATVHADGTITSGTAKHIDPHGSFTFGRGQAYKLEPQRNHHRTVPSMLLHELGNCNMYVPNGLWAAAWSCSHSHLTLAVELLPVSLLDGWLVVVPAAAGGGGRCRVN